MPRDADLELLWEYTRSESLRRHMLSVEAALRAYAVRCGEDPDLWGTAGLLHDFDYERWPNPPEHPLRGCEILQQRGYPAAVIQAIRAHTDCVPDAPRIAPLDKALFACDELCGFLTACSLVRPTRWEGLTAAGVRKKMRQVSFAAAVSREDLVRGAADFGVELDEHIDFCIAALQAAGPQIEADLARGAKAGQPRQSP